MASPSVHPAESLDDALKMFDSHIPLTHRERKLILQSLYDLAFKAGKEEGVEMAQNIVKAMLDSNVPLDYHQKEMINTSLYDLAFQEGARQGRQAGYEAAEADIKARMILGEQPAPPEAEVTGEYADPTTAIRKHLEDKLAAEAVRRSGDFKA